MNSLKVHAAHPPLALVVFLTGACVLVVEVVAVRVLSPHFGSTIYTVSSVISVILAALSIGYHWGGKLADRDPSEKAFYRIVLFSGLSVVGFHFLGILILPFFHFLFPITVGPLIAAILLFLFPALLLGMLSPFAVRLAADKDTVHGIGSISGNIFFWSTLGSIVGSLLAGFVLIPLVGIDTIFLGTGVLLFLIGAVPLFFHHASHHDLGRTAIILVVLLSAALAGVRAQGAQHLYSADGVYEKITISNVIQEGRPVRLFQQDRSSSGAMYLDTDDPRDLVYDYTKYYTLYKIFVPHLQNALVIGGGAYTIPKALHADSPDTHIVVSEIEPRLPDLAERYFHFQPDPLIETTTTDGRRLLQDTGTHFDLIISDVYYSLFSIPPHFTTQEFFMAAKDKLAPNGLFIANVIGDLSRQKPSLLFSEMRTFRSVFPNSYFFATKDPHTPAVQNIIFVGYNGDLPVDIKAASLAYSSDPILGRLSAKIVDPNRFDLSGDPLLTDNYAPIEYMTAALLRRAESVSGEFPDGREMHAVIGEIMRRGVREVGSPGAEAFRTALVAELSGTADSVLIQSFPYQTKEGKELRLANVIARFNPEKKRRIVLGSHYDSKTFADRDLFYKERPVPGANDSASGVAVLLEIARALHETPVLTDIGIDMVFFDGEEGDPLQTSADYRAWTPLGSAYFTSHLRDFYGDTPPETGLVLDMVCDKDLTLSKEANSVRDAQTYVDAFWSIGKKIDPSVFQDRITYDIRDDHTMLSAAGIPSFLVIDMDYPYFHTTRDTADKCSADSLRTVAQSVWNYVVLLNTLVQRSESAGLGELK